MSAALKPIDLGGPPERFFASVCDRPGSFFLESGLPADALNAHSFIGFDPYLTLRSQGDCLTLSGERGAESFRGDALAELKSRLQRHRVERRPEIPFPGGAVGYLSYEWGSRLEKIAPAGGEDPALPDAEFGFYDGLIAVEKKTNRAFLVANPIGSQGVEAIFERLERAVRTAAAPDAKPGETARAELRSNFSREGYLAAVARIKDYIRSGDAYQVNLAQRYETPFSGHPYDLYRGLRARSPAPFAAYLNAGSVQVVSSSPERFLRVQGRRVETRPIKGTRPRGRNPEQDLRLREELLASEKDRAELLMIVDLERNDLGRVCEYGSVRVEENRRLESHPTVHHLVATVTGTLREDCDAFDCVRAAFPGGSITGAPKIRAMQIIAELETRRRHLYTGAIGYFGFDGGCDLSIAIRTILCRRGLASYHVGGGVVWDSDPQAEYQETLDKGRAMHETLAQPPLP